MKLAEKFNFPIVTLIDTPGAYPGVDAEESGQSEAIAQNIYVMSTLKVPVISVVIGEGGSGGALAIGVANRVLMLEHSVYSVISPEGCASILWDDKKKVKQAANALCLTSKELIKLKVIDQIEFFRLMKLAEKFNFPIVTFIDTPGAYPGVDAEESGQSEAIAQNIYVMSTLKVPVISVVIGEGGSGGALAIGVANRVLMLEHSVYSVISPEGCASILWDDKKKVKQAANALCLTSKELIKLKVIDQIVSEPLGGAHRHPKRAAILLKKALRVSLQDLSHWSPEQLAQQRQEKFRNIGVFQTEDE